MLYISDADETLKGLMVKEEFTGTQLEYERKFAEMNPEFCAKFPNYKDKLPDYMPMVLVTQPIFDPSCRAEIVNELFLFSDEERQSLRIMQEQQWDIPVQIALTDVLKGLQEYASGFRKWLDVPLVVSPWKDLGSALTRASLFDFSEGTLKFGAERIENSSRYILLDKLYKNMMMRDLLNRQLHMLRDKRGGEALAIKKDLSKQIKELNALIKKQLPEKMSKALPKYVNKRFTADEIAKMRSSSYSSKATVTTKIDVLNKSGLGRLKAMTSELKMLGEGVNKTAALLNYGVVAYDAKEAYKTGGGKAAMRTFVTGASAIYITSSAVSAVGGTTALGGFVIGTLAGDAALGTTLLICSPVLGWVIVIGVGVAVSGYVGYKAKGYLEQVWDIGEDLTVKAYHEASKAASLVHEELRSAWDSGSHWVLSFYGTQ